MNAAQIQRLSKLRGLYAEWKRQRQEGENPSLSRLVPEDKDLRRELADFIEDPQLAAEQFAALDAMTAALDSVEVVDDEAETPARRSHVPDIPGYEILGEIDAGGMGVVYKAKQLRLNRTVAIKVIHFIKQHRSKEIIRFLGEAESVAAIDHPYVVQVFESNNANGIPYIAMEYLAGGTLAELLRRHGRMEPKFVAQLIRKIASGVQAAHDQQIIHRDLKPGNIMFDADGEPRVTDFGLAKRRYSGDLTSTQTVMGSPEYMSPEQAMGESKYVGPQADIWALGVIMYELLTGSRPFASSNKMEAIRLITQTNPRDMRTFVPELPLQVQLIVEKCLEKDPDARYLTARALARDLKKWLSGKELDLVPSDLSDKFVGYLNRNRPVVVIAAMVVLIAFLIFMIVRLNARISRLEQGSSGREQAQRVADEGASIAVFPARQRPS